MAWGRFKAATYSPCETDYLKEHKNDPVTQLAGYLGKSLNSIKNKLLELDGKLPKQAKRSGKGTKIGKRADLNLFMRSGWEANYCRYLLHVGVPKDHIQYEPTTFSYLDHYKHGTVTYVPDFRVTGYPGSKLDWNWVEVKGFLKSEDRTKLNRFKRFYPADFERLIFCCGGPKTKAWEFAEKLGIKTIISYNDIKKQYSKQIENWE